MEKLNIAELLKDCPKGMELDCTNYSGVVTFEKITDNATYPIKIKVKCGDEYFTHTLTKYGQTCKTPYNKCIIFPKGKTTWEGFQSPFKDGDVVAYDNSHRTNLQIFIFKDKRENDTLSHCYLMLDGNELDLEEGSYYVTRLATEEEKQKLFDAIKANGYKWNAETKTLEKLIEPKFKVGDRVLWKYDTETPRTICEVKLTSKGGYVYWINCEDCPSRWWDETELIPIPNKFDITTLKPFDKVLIRQADFGKWGIDFFGYYDKEYHNTTGRCVYRQCIPYEGNEHLLGTTNDCDEYFKTWE